MRKAWITIGMLFSLGGFCWAQQRSNDSVSVLSNLVYNGSFEEYRNCPRKVDASGVLTIVEGWYQPTKGSADYFNTCGTKECGVPKNKMGVQEAHSGNGYCGIYCSKTEYREYLQTKLKRRLAAGDSIRMTFYVSLSEESTGAIATLGGLFTDQPLSDTTHNLLLAQETERVSSSVSRTVAKPYTPQIENHITHPLTDTRNWQCVSGVFVAKGGERYVTIGNFAPIERAGYCEPCTLSKMLPGAYYYIDDITIECLNCHTAEEGNLSIDSSYLTESQPTFSVGSTFVLKDIFFEFDKSILLQQSYFELLKLRILLEKHPKMCLEIRGHTDNKGSASYNQRLSENRAKAVADYLISKGISEKRIQYHGYGKSMPVDDNDTEEGRANNRRVEFKILSL